MEVFKADGKFVLGVNGGEIYSLRSEHEAIILTNRPVPTKMWTISTIKDTSMHRGEEWYVDTELREFLCDERKVFIFQFKYHRNIPGYCSGIAEFFVTEEYAKEKIDALRKTSRVTEYSWDDTIPTWKEVHLKKYYRRA